MPKQRAPLATVVPLAAVTGEPPEKNKKALFNLFPAWGDVDQRESVMVGLPAAGAAYFTDSITQSAVDTASATMTGKTVAGDTVPLPQKHVLPQIRAAKYEVLRMMARDPTIDSAIKMHIANALSAKSDAVDSVTIAQRDGEKPDKIVEELNDVLMPFVRKDLNEWARKAAVYGSCFARIYGKHGEGIENIRCDYFTHPRFIQKFEKGGRLAGYTATYQGTSAHVTKLQLLPPWTFVGFEIPEWQDLENFEPISVGGQPVDLAIDDDAIEGLIESQEYGTSLIETAYGPWLDLLDALASLKMSRRNAARLERIISVNTGKLDPLRAAGYLDQVAERMINASNEIQTQSYLNGTVQTVVNHILPNFSDKGGLQVDTVQGTPDIQGVEDVLFHVKRLGGALGIDPSLLGFGDLLSGGLGDGGFFRVSVLASTKATLLRRAIANGLHRLCEIHVAYKYGKIFLPKDCPWEIKFNSVSTAIEREEQEALESRANIAGSLIGVIGAADQEFNFIDRRELFHEVWRLLKKDDESFERVFPAEKAKSAEETAAKFQEQMLNNTDEDNDDFRPGRP